MYLTLSLRRYVARFFAPKNDPDETWHISVDCESIFARQIWPWSAWALGVLAQEPLKVQNLIKFAFLVLAAWRCDSIPIKVWYHGTTHHWSTFSFQISSLCWKGYRSPKLGKFGQKRVFGVSGLQDDPLYIPTKLNLVWKRRLYRCFTLVGQFWRVADGCGHPAGFAATGSRCLWFLVAFIIAQSITLLRFVARRCCLLQ